VVHEIFLHANQAAFAEQFLRLPIFAYDEDTPSAFAVMQKTTHSQS
jgi:hypothetical protein